MPRKATTGKPEADVHSELQALRARNAELEARNEELESAIEAPTVLDIERPRSAGSVTVACKVPMGMVLQLQTAMERPIPTGRGFDGDFKMVAMNVFTGRRYHVFGPSIPAQGGLPDGYILPKIIEGGYALTEGIPAEFWEKWLEQNAKAEYVTNRMIFAYQGARNARAAAEDHGTHTSGLEPLSRDIDAKGRMTDRRIPKPLTASVARIGYDAERDAERKGQSVDA